VQRRGTRCRLSRLRRNATIRATRFGSAGWPRTDLAEVTCWFSAGHERREAPASMRTGTVRLAAAMVTGTR